MTRIMRLAVLLLPAVVVAAEAGELAPIPIPLSRLTEKVKVPVRDIIVEKMEEEWRGPLQFSADGKLIAHLGGGACGARIWELESGRERKDRIWCSGYKPDGGYGSENMAKIISEVWTDRDLSRLAYLMWNGQVLVHDAGSEPKKVWRTKRNPKYGAGFAQSALHPDGRTLALAEKTTWKQKARIVLLDLERRKKVRSFRGRLGVVTGLTFGPKGNILVAITEGWGGLTVWDMDRPSRHRSGEHFGANYEQAAVSPDGGMIAIGEKVFHKVSSAPVNPVRLYDPATMKEIRTLGKLSYVGPLAFSPDSTLLAAGGRGGTTVWDLRSRRATFLQARSSTTYTSAAFSPDGQALAVWDKDRIKLYQDKAMKEAFQALYRDSAALRHAIESSSADPDSAEARVREELKLKLAALKSEDAELLGPKGEFETTGEYEKRIEKARKHESALRAEYRRKADHARTEAFRVHAERRKSMEKTLARLKTQSYPFIAKAKVGRYDADKERFGVTVMGREYWMPLDRTQAKIFRAIERDVTAPGRLRYRDGESAELVLDGVLRDETSRKDYPLVQAVSAGAVASAAPAKAPPDLRIESISFVEPSGEGYLDEGETGHVRVRVRNAGRGWGFGVRLSLRAESPAGGAAAGIAPIDKIKVGNVGPGDTRHFSAPVSAVAGVKRGEVRVKTELFEANGFDSLPRVLSFRAREFLPPDLKLAKIEILDAGGSRVIRKGRECEVTLTVRNTGRGAARGVVAELRSANSNVRLFSGTSVSLGKLAPGESKQARFSVAVARRYDGPKTLPVTVRLREGRPRFTVEPAVALALGEEAPDIQLVEVLPDEPERVAKGRESVDRPPSVPKASRAFGSKDYAVVIGIERYRNVPKSDYSYADAKLVRAYLRALGIPKRNIEFLSDGGATRSALDKSLGRWLRNRVKGGRVVVYYSGHGAPDPAKGDAYLVPHDGDPNYLAETAYPMKKLYRELGRLKASEIFVVLDACFTGTGGRSVLAKGARPLVMKLKTGAIPDNTAVLTATRDSQISTSSPDTGHGVFTYHFLKALRDGEKDLGGVFGKLKPRVEDDAKVLNVDQSPTLRPGLKRVRGRFQLRR